MKREKILFLNIILFLLCSCAACAGTIPSADDKEVVQADILFNEQTEEVQTEEVSLQSTYTIERAARVSSVSLDFYDEVRSTKTGEDTLLCTYTCRYPVVTIEGNEEAADKINAGIQEKINSFYTDSSVSESAKWDYQNIYEPNDSEFHFYPYSDELIFTAARADSKVISFLVTSQYYVGGAHGMDFYVGLNYDTQTGELIDFADLSGNADAFGQGTLAFIQSLASTAAYQGIMWEDGIDELQEILYQDNRWYLSTSGLVFFSNPYELGAFFAGKIEFTVPYSDLEELGFSEKYDDTGTRTIWLQTEEICSWDLNGDGQTEEIQFYIDAKGRADTDVHFIIDGTDYAEEHEELSGQFSDDNYVFCWAKCFLVDLDPADDTTEIAFEMNYTSWKDDVVIPYIFLYRYEGDGVLTYLGRVEGTITDPTAVFIVHRSA